VPEYSENKSGDRFVWDQNQGGWRPLTPTDIRLEQQAGLKALTYTAEIMTGIPGLAHPETRQALETRSPVGLPAAEMATLAGAGVAIPASLIRRGAQRFGQKRMADRVQEKLTPIQGDASELSSVPFMRPENITAQQLDTVAGAMAAFGEDSVGAAAQGGLFQFLKNQPVLRETLEGLEDFIGVKSPLSPDQQLLLDSGNAERLGFKWLPGQREGNQVMSEALSSSPFIRDAFEPILAQNAQNLGARVMRALNLNPKQGFGRDVLQQGRDSVGGMFDDVAKNLPDVTLSDDVVKALDDVLTPAEVRAYGVEPAQKGIERTLQAGGRDLMELRKQLADAATNRATREGQDKVQRTMSQAVDRIDEIIDDALEAAGKTDTRRVWQEAKLRWRVQRAMERPGVVTTDGDVSLKKLNNSLQREFESEYGRSLFAPKDMIPDVRDLLDYSRLARSFESNLGDSGTATRAAIIQLFTNPKSYAKQRMGAKFITNVLLDDPGRAASIGN
jgi:hypothetical protein